MPNLMPVQKFQRLQRLREEVTHPPPDRDTPQHFFFCHVVIERYELNVAEIPKGRMKKPDVKDFKRLNKVVLAEGATNASVSTFSIAFLISLT